MPSVTTPPTTVLITALVVAVVVAATLGWLCYRLLVARGQLLLRLANGERADARAGRRARGLPAGAYLADFALPALSGTDGGATVALSSLAGRPLLITFLRADCFFSRAFARELASQPPPAEAPLTLSISILLGEADGTEAWEPFARLPGLVLLDAHGQVARLMRVTATPSGYLVDAGRQTVGRLLTGPIALLAAARNEAVPDVDKAALAVSQIPRGASAARRPLPVGSAAPGFTLPTLDGDEWSLAAHRGEPLTLLFSDPDCPPCAAVLAALGQRSQNGMVIVSRGDAEENRHLATATGITAPVLIQRQREVARAFRTLETPAAYRIGARGEIVAGPAVGMDTILSLLDGGRSGSMNRGVSGAGSVAW